LSSGTAEGVLGYSILCLENREKSVTLVMQKKKCRTAEDFDLWVLFHQPAKFREHELQQVLAAQNLSSSPTLEPK
jgi:hypothetical protein